MKIKPGEKVKFLNEKGGGTVKKIIDSRLALVTIEDGFDIPVLISDLIRIGNDEPGSRFFDNNYKPVEEESSEHTEEHIPEITYSGSDDLAPELINSRKQEEVFLAFIPADQKIPVNGALDVVIVNNTSADLIYNIYIKKNDTYSGADYGSVEAGKRYTVATVEREELTDWTDGIIQILFHRESADDVPPPFNAGFTISGKKFFNEESYRYSKMLSARGIVIKLVTLENPVSKEISAGNIDPEPVPVSARINPPSDDFIIRHQTADREAVVDLHIHELLEDPSHLQKNEILDYQRNYFMRCMESAIVNHFRKVIFIHGVGNGILKNELLDYLLKEKGIDIFDAPMSKYGVGAVEVRIRQNAY